MDQKTRQRLCKYGTAVTPVQATVDTQDLVGWIVKGLAAVVMFLLALGAKEIRDRMLAAEAKAQECLNELNDLKARVRFLEAVYEREK